MSDGYELDHTFRDYARRLEKLERKQREASRAPADLRHSAIDGGQFVQKNRDGHITYRIGEDPVTGVTAPEYLNGPIPKPPEVPHVDEGGETLKIQLSGLDENGNPAPNDFRRAEIHVSLEEDFEPDLSTLAGFINNPNDSFTHRIPGGEWYIRAVWVTLSNKRSRPSEVAFADIEPLVSTDDIQEVLDEAQERLDEARADFEAGNDARKSEIEDLQNNVIPALEDALGSKADKSALEELDEKLDNFEFPELPDIIPDKDEVEALIDAAEQAAKEHADLVADGAKSDAIAEAEAKANAAKEAAEQAAKDYADQVSQAAMDRASAAEDFADGLPKVMHGTSAPSGTAPDESVWYQHEGDISGPVIAQWVMANGSWESTEIASEAIANLDVGKLTAGSAEVVETVTEKLLANQAIVNRLIAEDAFINGDMLVDGTIGTRQIDAEKIFTNETVAETIWAEVVRAGMLEAEEAFIGGALIKDDTIDAAKINVTEELTAQVAQFLEIEAGMIKSNAFEGETFTGGTFVGGTFESHVEPERGVKLTEDGLKTYKTDGEQTFHANAHDGSVEMTGWVRSKASGRPEVAVLGVSELANRPGLMLDTGTSDGAQPTIFSSANSTLGIPAGTLYLTSREKDLNDSGRGTLMLSQGGNVSLGASFGSNAGTGFHTNGGEVAVRGYSKTTFFPDQQIKIGRTGSSTSNAETIAWDVVFGAPAPRGSHTAAANSYSAMTKGHRTGSVGITGSSASKLRFILGNRQPSNAGTWSIYWAAYWVVG